MFRQNVQYTRRSHHTGSATPVLRWSFTTGRRVGSSPTVGADGTIYVGSNDDSLYAINPDGTQRWRYTTKSDVRSSPAIGDDGVIYFGSYDKRLYAVTQGTYGDMMRACFIATATYGSPMAEQVEILREFRDEYLATNPAGQAFVDLYYRVSSPIAEFITEHPSMKPVVRAALSPVVAMSALAVNTSSIEKAAIAGLLVLVSVAAAIWAIRQRGKDPRYSRG
jgi:PQQ-like domain